ncbi:molybdenum cofactor biosynthesis protein B [Parasphingorhabdus sp.]|uniref:molybdenum cofactor biosynthesis protein B n=1 Tax=Parasphingorhabdus sp. TaxID=2709688 RepID=UPI003A8F2DA3
MAGIDKALTFYPLKIAVMTISDTRTKETDTSGGLLIQRLEAAGHSLADRAIVTDDKSAIKAQAQKWIDDPEVEIILTTGGTGFTERDVTPEAIKPMFRRYMDGFSVLFHQASLGTIGVSTLQSRAFAGQAGDSFIFCVPGSTGACRDAWDMVLSNELDSRHRPCSIAGLLPRLHGLCA